MGDTDTITLQPIDGSSALVKITYLGQGQGTNQQSTDENAECLFHNVPPFM
jgi:hypothetical protein